MSPRSPSGLLNRRAVVRCDHNPFEHGEKPFIRIVDYFQEGEFWGIGEIEPLEGLQDLENALWNQRVDNVRLVLNKMLAFDPDNIHDLRDLQIRPGGTIRVRSRDIPAREVLQAIDIPDVTSSSYTEAAEIERMTEKVSGVSAYTTGTDSPTMNQTATGVSLITEQSNTRFSLKVKMAELTGLGVIARQYGSILQQFMPQTQAIRILNDDGVKQWVSIDAESLQGGFDFFIEAESSTITESVRKEQSMSLMQTFSQMIDPITPAAPAQSAGTRRRRPGSLRQDEQGPLPSRPAPAPAADGAPDGSRDGHGPEHGSHDGPQRSGTTTRAGPEPDHGDDGSGPASRRPADATGSAPARIGGHIGPERPGPASLTRRGGTHRAAPRRPAIAR